MLQTAARGTSKSKKLPHERYLEAFRIMLQTRIFEDKLASLYRGGLITGGVYLGKGQEAVSVACGLFLQKGDVFAPLIRELEQEIARAAAADKLAGVDVARYSHRLFDRRFLRLPEARFVLAGVVNRPDRAAFDPASCGETRLVYRLAYALDSERASKLPMTLGI